MNNIVKIFLAVMVVILGIGFVVEKFADKSEVKKEISKSSVIKIENNKVNEGHTTEKHVLKSAKCEDKKLEKDSECYHSTGGNIESYSEDLNKYWNFNFGFEFLFPKELILFEEETNIVRVENIHKEKILEFSIENNFVYEKGKFIFRSNADYLIKCEDLFHGNKVVSTGFGDGSWISNSYSFVTNHSIGAYIRITTDRYGFWEENNISKDEQEWRKRYKENLNYENKILETFKLDQGVKILNHECVGIEW